jgi:hypothetical protein
MQRLLVIALAVAAVLGLGFLAAQVSGPAGADPVPAIELRQPAPDRAPTPTVEQDGSATRPPVGGGNGAEPVRPPSPAPAGGRDDDGGDDDDADEEDDADDADDDADGGGDDGGGDD